MEAIEFALAEYGISSVKLVLATARDVLNGHFREEAILDFCPIIGTEIDLDEPLMCVEADEVLSSTRCLVPAELVFHPFMPEMGSQCYFASNTNGLCSGNSVLEATVHGLAEVIERDIRSFQSFYDTSWLVHEQTFPDVISGITELIRSADLVIYVRYAPNVFNLPYFTAVVAEHGTIDPIYVSGGYGCHPCKEIAMTRAVCEALQSRLSFIHGGRDDLADHYEQFAKYSPDERAKFAQALVSQISSVDRVIDFGTIPDRTNEADSLESAFKVLASACCSVGATKICRVAYTDSADPIQVIRVLVPRLEFFTLASPRLGLRLRDYARSLSQL
jgi:ribosomal protein S12 methylthiotransferase accessory factor